MAEMTPLMKQYQEIKKQYADCILFFRLGDFYEMFNEDAKLASKELDLALTARDKNKPPEEQTPMCGIPYHASDGYIARLIAKGYKVAICEQMEDPATVKGLVKRDIVRVVTPGTADASMLEGSGANYIAGVYREPDRAGICFCEVTTGKTYVTSFEGTDMEKGLARELGRFEPKETVVSPQAAADKRLTAYMKDKIGCRVENRPASCFELRPAAQRIQGQFGKETAARIPGEDAAAIMALGGLLEYLYDTQRRDLSYIKDMEYFRQGGFLELDLTARRNLELTETIRGKQKKGSLLWALDRTRTAMGGRMLRLWLERPLLSVTAINKRLSAVEELVNHTIAREELAVALAGVGDMERMVSRIAYGTAGGRDMAALRASLEKLPYVRECLGEFSAGRMGELARDFDALEDIRLLLADAFVDEPPFSVREGGFIRDGYNKDVDRFRNILTNTAGIVADLEEKERKKTGIRTLKISYNKVFGYYIEISKSYADKVPEEYIRKQTLVNNERYITAELRELEQRIFTAKDRVVALEFQLFTELRQKIMDETRRIQTAAALVGEIDVLASLATAAVKQNYCRPQIDESGILEIHEGRHPMVERSFAGEMFVPNDTYMGGEDGRLAVITGPNMAGKSTYMRQVALITLMAQMGSFVPAKSARIGVVDQIFTRIGASDDLSAGKSTFMVEMTEVAEILQKATPRSLVILDEIGRGTSTFDGMSIARAVLEYCADTKKMGCKTLFATHYHELTALESQLPGVKNFNISIRTRGEEIIFLRKIVPGGADRSYGIEVAKLAGLPETVIQRARAILQELESQPGHTAPVLAAPKTDQVSMDALVEEGAREAEEVMDRLRRTQPDSMTPMEALELLYELKELLK